VDDDLLDLSTFSRMLTETKWMSKAACKGMDTNLFFPERGDTSTVEMAKSVCAQCPVSDECYQYGEREKMGIWGGASTRQRERARGVRL